MFLNVYYEQAASLGLTITPSGSDLIVYRDKAHIGIFSIPIRSRDITQALSEWETKTVQAKRLKELRERKARTDAGLSPTPPRLRRGAMVPLMAMALAMGGLSGRR